MQGELGWHDLSKTLQLKTLHLNSKHEASLRIFVKNQGTMCIKYQIREYLQTRLRSVRSLSLQGLDWILSHTCLHSVGWGGRHSKTSCFVAWRHG